MTNPTGVLVRARQLRKDYGRGEALVRAVDAVDLEVANGEAVAVMGPSGCGKSTLLHLPGGLDRPTVANCGSASGASTSCPSVPLRSCGAMTSALCSRRSISWTS